MTSEIIEILKNKNKPTLDLDLINALKKVPVDPEIFKNKKPPIDLEILTRIKPSFDKEMYEILNNAERIDWEREGNSKEWNTKAKKELNAKKQIAKIELIHKSIFGY